MRTKLYMLDSVCAHEHEAVTGLGILFTLDR